MNLNAALVQLTRDSTFGKDFNLLTTALIRTMESARFCFSTAVDILSRDDAP
jgi:hypothetical protein